MAKPMTLTVLRNRMKDVCGRINDGEYGTTQVDDPVWACIDLLDEYEAGLAPAGEVGGRLVPFGQGNAPHNEEYDLLLSETDLLFLHAEVDITLDNDDKISNLAVLDKLRAAWIALQLERDDLREKCKIFCNPDGVIATNMVTIQAGRDLARTMIQKLLPTLEGAIHATPSGDSRNALCDLNIEARVLLKRLGGA